MSSHNFCHPDKKKLTFCDFTKSIPSRMGGPCLQTAHVSKNYFPVNSNTRFIARLGWTMGFPFIPMRLSRSVESDVISYRHFKDLPFKVKAVIGDAFTLQDLKKIMMKNWMKN